MCVLQLTETLPFSQRLSDTPSEAAVVSVQQAVPHLPPLQPRTLLFQGSLLSFDSVRKASQVPRLKVQRRREDAGSLQNTPAVGGIRTRTRCSLGSLSLSLSPRLTHRRPSGHLASGEGRGWGLKLPYSQDWKLRQRRGCEMLGKDRGASRRHDQGLKGSVISRQVRQQG